MALPGHSAAVLVPSIRLSPVGISARVLDYTRMKFRFEITDGNTVKELSRNWGRLRILHNQVSRESKVKFQFPKKNRDKSLRKTLRISTSDLAKTNLQEYLQKLLQLQPVPMAVCDFMELEPEECLPRKLSWQEEQNHDHVPVVTIDKTHFESDNSRIKQQVQHFNQQKQHMKGSGDDALLLGVFLAFDYDVT